MPNERRANGLSWLWEKHPHGRIKRILFVTYRFNFVWFHNEVLPRLREVGDYPEVLVLATRNDGEEGSGDLYDLGEWTKWGQRFRRHYVQSDDYLLHAKLILVERSRRRKSVQSRLSLGYGSANLTPTGWLKNLETWSWTEGRPELCACGGLLRYLGQRDPALKLFLDSWTEILPSSAPHFGWLFDRKSSTRDGAFAAAKELHKARPTVVRIVSPYWDRGSLNLLSELLREVNVNHIELWIDGSRKHARASDYARVIGIFDAYADMYRVLIKAPAWSRSLDSPFPLHAKLIELETSGRATKLFGSANFTGAAWTGNHNIETLGFVTNAVPFPLLLTRDRQDVAINTLTRDDVERLGSNANEDDEGEVGASARPWINWATLDETASERVLTASYHSPWIDLPAVEIIAGFHPAREDKEDAQTLERLRHLESEYSKSEHWRLVADESIVRATYIGPHLTLPETLKVRLRFQGHYVVSANVEILNPDLDGQRDKRTGVPLLASLDSILRGRHPIVAPLPKISTDEDPDESDDEEEELDSSTKSDATLATIPEYNRLPAIEQVLSIYTKAMKASGSPKDHAVSITEVIKRAEALQGQLEDKVERIAVQALLQALRGL